MDAIDDSIDELDDNISVLSKSDSDMSDILDKMDEIVILFDEIKSNVVAKEIELQQMFIQNEIMSQEKKYS